MSHPSRLPGPGAAPGPDPEVIASVVETCTAVAGLHGGVLGEVASYLPGRRVRGVRVTDSAVELHVVGRYPAPVDEIVAQVRAALGPVTGALPVDVTIADLALPGEPDPPHAIVHDRPAEPAPATEPAFPTPAGRPPRRRAPRPVRDVSADEPTRSPARPWRGRDDHRTDSTAAACARAPEPGAVPPGHG